MNCANHSGAIAVAYCRTCGKPLCSSCTRDIHGVIYCESCLAARMGATPPPPVPPVPPVGTRKAPGEPSGPNPALAGILAGMFPFGVGAVYTGQYAKGLAHLIVFVLFIVGLGSNAPWFIITSLALAFAFFYVYQIIDAIRSAHAVLQGDPAPDPFGLAQSFGAGEKVDTSKIPFAALILIAMGVLFLAQTSGLFDIDASHIWPFFLIAIGGWLFAKRWGFLGMSPNRCYCERCRLRGVMGAAVLVTVGVLSLLDSFGRGWGHTWPILLIVIGLVKILQGQAPTTGHREFPASYPATPPPPAAPSAEPPQPPPEEVHNV